MFTGIVLFFTLDVFENYLIYENVQYRVTGSCKMWINEKRWDGLSCVQSKDGVKYV